MRAQSRSLAYLAASVAFGVPASLAAPITVNYPSAECPDTGEEGLQQCVDSIDAGSTVVLASEVIEELVSISKSLTLRAVDRSLRPLLTGVSVTTPTGSGPVPPMNVTVQDIRATLGLRVDLAAGAGHSVAVKRVETGQEAFIALGISLSTKVPASFTVERSVIRGVRADQGHVLGLFAENTGGSVYFRIVGNVITAGGDPESGSGIRLGVGGPGSVRADIMNNVISDVGRCECGAAAGVTILPDGEIKADVNIVGNTIHRSASDAVQQRNDLTTGRLSLDIFNNIFSRTSVDVNLESGSAGSLVYRAGFNNVFKARPGSLDGQSAGPGNLNLDPRYVDPERRDLRLRSDSPLRDKGLVCSPGGVANPEASGRHRLNGASVDIGAFEAGAPGITGLVRLGSRGADDLGGTSGRDILCGFAGADVLRGLAGPDYLDGGRGPDRVVGGLGPDRLLGDSGNDTLCARDGAGGDHASGGPGTDRASPNPGDTRNSIERPAGC